MFLVAQLGLLERENAAILNASILRYAQRTIHGFQQAMQALQLTCPLYLTQNDGTLTSASAATRLPIRTFASGPTNSMRGAAYLAGLDDPSSTMSQEDKSIIVVDIGGTTTDVGVLLPSGFPRQAGAFIEVAGVRTNFSMADIQSVGLGGGSRVVVSETDGSITVGPTSVGHLLTQTARVFGGDTLTASDIAVAAKLADIGTPALVASLDRKITRKAKNAISKKLERVIDRYDHFECLYGVNLRYR